MSLELGLSGGATKEMARQLRLDPFGGWAIQALVYRGGHQQLLDGCGAMLCAIGFTLPVNLISVFWC